MPPMKHLTLTHCEIYLHAYRKSTDLIREASWAALSCWKKSAWKLVLKLTHTLRRLVRFESSTLTAHGVTMKLRWHD